MISRINNVTGYELVVMDDHDNAAGFLGWIRLLDGDASAGYLYLTDAAKAPRLGGPEASPYVVMSRPKSELAALLAFLADGRAKTIRYSGETERGGSAFLEHGQSGNPDQAEGLLVFEQVRDS